MASSTESSVKAAVEHDAVEDDAAAKYNTTASPSHAITAFEKYPKTWLPSLASGRVNK
jgi:hypothetical protein